MVESFFIGVIYGVIFIALRVFTDEELEKDYESLDIFTKLWSYVGKAKNPITSIFEVKNE